MSAVNDVLHAELCGIHAERKRLERHMVTLGYCIGTDFDGPFAAHHLANLVVTAKECSALAAEAEAKYRLVELHRAVA